MMADDVESRVRKTGLWLYDLINRIFLQARAEFSGSIAMGSSASFSNLRRRKNGG
jgi:hypothetical protein